MWSQPPCFWIRTSHLGHSLAMKARRILEAILSRSNFMPLMCRLYSEHVFPSCQGTSCTAQDRYPHVSHWKQGPFSVELWVWPASQPGLRHHRKFGIRSFSARIMSLSYLRGNSASNRINGRLVTRNKRKEYIFTSLDALLENSRRSQTLDVIALHHLRTLWANHRTPRQPREL